MKHLAKIQAEFLKNSSWDNLSLEQQKEYLKQHPKSKKRITSKPKTTGQPKKINLDFMQMNDDLKSALKKFNIEMKDFNESGPGGGNPNANFHGSEENLKKFLKWYDEDQADDLAETIEDDK